MNYYITVSVIFLSTFIFISCDINNNVRTYKLAKVNKLNIDVVNKSNRHIKLSWNKPDSWVISSGSSMRIGSFDVPYNNGIGDLSVIKLQGDGGGITSNINRWRGQLNLNSISLSEIEKDLIFFEGNLGSYSVVEIYDSNNLNAFVCAIIPYGEATIFVKLSIQSNGIKQVRQSFIDFCSSLK